MKNIKSNFFQKLYCYEKNIFEISDFQKRFTKIRKALSKLGNYCKSCKILFHLNFKAIEMQ